MHFYGLDWGAMGASLLALSLLGRKNRFGFLAFMVANLCWICFGLLTGSLAVVASNMVFFGVNLRGLRNWSTST